jgi:serine/threonine protein kinase/WD40 repeat protein
MTQKPVSETEIFRAAAQLPPAQRPAFLDEACGDNRSLRHEIESLLRAHDPEGSFLQSPAIAVTIDQAIGERVGSMIGPYKLREQIGEGGFGVVYVAEQERPVRRKVALKVIKPGMDTKDVIARFEAERQALALMDHPNVARVLDAGATDSGRPYFVMELVHGVPITEFCDKNKLATRERLLLFADVCRAVQHAHQKGIIHRDLKPSNVMVTLHDGKPVAKIIDFGVSKAISQQLTERSIYTAYGQMIGTPVYMSPEQAEMSGLGIDTRSDIYSLGVLLYELLTGKTPLDLNRLREGGYGEMLRMIREDEPPRPSMKISTLGEEATAIALHRHTDPVQLRRSLRGELDWIVMKCLEKDRSRRYETALGLARDLDRYLRDDPVEACPPSASYRLRKFARKHRVALAVAAMFLGLLIAAVGVSMWQRNVALAAAAAARRAQEAESTERRRAVKSATVAAEAERSAVQERNNALAAREELRETLYSAEMNLVQSAADSKQYARAAQLLDEQRPGAGQRDLRGFEWYYWYRTLHRGQRRSTRLVGLQPMPQGVLNQRVFSRGALRLTAICKSHENTSGRGLVGVFDTLTGRELVAPFAPFPDQEDNTGYRLQLAVSRDGTRIAVRFLSIPSSGAESTTHISIRDGSSGAEIRRWSHPGGVILFALTADGSRLIAEHVVRYDPSGAKLPEIQAVVKVWNTSTGEIVHALPPIPYPPQPRGILPNRANWSLSNPDGTQLLRSAFSEELENDKPKLFQRFETVDIETGKSRWSRELPGRTYPLTLWSWSPDGKLIALAEHEAPAKPTLQLWDSQSGATLAVLDRDTASFISPDTLALSADGQRLATSSVANEVYVWKLPQLSLADQTEPLRLAKPDLVLPTVQEIYTLAFSADGYQLMGLDAGTSLTTWDVTEVENNGLGPDLAKGADLAEFNSDLSQIAFFVHDPPHSAYILWDLVSNAEISRFDSTYALRPEFTPDGRLAMVNNSIQGPDETRIVFHDTKTGDKCREIPIERIDLSSSPYVIDQALSPNGKNIAALVSDRYLGTKRRLNVWSTATGERLFSMTLDAEEPKGLDYTHDGSRILVGTANPSALVFFDAATGARQNSVSLPPSSRVLFVDPRRHVIGLSHESDFVVCDFTSGRELLRLRGYDGVRPYSFAISPDGARLALGRSSRGENSEITLWNMKSGRRLLSLQRDRPVDALYFTPDGNRLLAVNGSSSVRTAEGSSKAIHVYDATPRVETE